MSTNSRSLLSIEATAATLEKLINALSNYQKYTILTFVDISLFLTSIIAAIGFEWGFTAIPIGMWHLGKFIVLEIAIKIGLFWAFRIYQQVSRYIDGEFIFTIAKAVVASYLAIVVIANWFITPEIPASVLINDGMLTLILVIAFRLSVRLTMGKMRQINAIGNSCGVVIYGAGSAGCILAQALAGENSKRLIGFVDDSPYLQGRNIQGTRVYAPGELLQLKSISGFEEILLAMPLLDGERKRDILAKLQVLGVPIETVPSMTEILSGHVSIGKVRELAIEDLQRFAGK